MLHVYFPSSCLESWYTVGRGCLGDQPPVKPPGPECLVRARHRRCHSPLPGKKCVLCASTRRGSQKWVPGFPGLRSMHIPLTPVDLLCLHSVMNHSHECNSLCRVILWSLQCIQLGEWGDPLHDCLVAFSVSEERFDTYKLHLPGYRYPF